MAFFISPPGADERYKHLFTPEFDREHQARALVERLWEQTAQFLDRDVQAAACNDFLARFWEMYLAAGLLNGGLTLVPSRERKMKAGGPDILVAAPQCYVEATVAQPGTGADAVSEAEPFVVRPVPKREITLRLRGAIEEKYKKYQRYVEKGILGPSDPYVVGIDGAALPSTRGEPELPWIVCAVFPFGNSVYQLDSETLKVTEHSYAPEHNLEKSSGSRVAKDIFLGQSHAGISALVYCWADEYNAAPFPGKDFIVVHNPFAKNPVARGVLPGYLECYVEDDSVMIDRRSA